MLVLHGFCSAPTKYFSSSFALPYKGNSKYFEHSERDFHDGWESWVLKAISKLFQNENYNIVSGESSRERLHQGATLPPSTSQSRKSNLCIQWKISKGSFRYKLNRSSKIKDFEANNYISRESTSLMSTYIITLQLQRRQTSFCHESISHALSA